jgi:hypothetical protein
MSTAPTQNHELAERIGAAARGLKQSNDSETRFVRPWRMDANSNRPLREESDCGCGISPDVK